MNQAPPSMPGSMPPVGGMPPGGAPGGNILGFLGPSGGLWIAILLAVTLVVLAIVFWRLLGRVGKSPAAALLMLVPVVNLSVALWAAFAEWPVEREMKRLKLALASSRAESAEEA